MVFVVKKRPLSEVPPTELIPPEIDGVKTDVFESDVVRLNAGSTPAITSVAPSSLSMQNSAVTVTVNGSGFQEGLSVALKSPTGVATTISGFQVSNVTAASFQVPITPTEVGWYTMQVTNPDAGTSNVFSFSAADVGDYNPLVGGIRISPGGVTPDVIKGATLITPSHGVGGFGTLGCFVKTADANPKVLAVTCHHVVGLPALGLSTQLTGTAASPTITFGGSNTQNTLIAVKVKLGDTAFEVFYRTSGTDSPGSIATTIAARITALAIAGVGATADTAAQTVTVTSSTLSLGAMTCLIFGAPAPDPKADIRATIDDLKTTLSGTASKLCGAYVNFKSRWNIADVRRLRRNRIR
jgi:hypothetical protein